MANATTLSARIALYAASSISGATGHSVLLPETLLVALIQDPILRDHVSSADEETLLSVVRTSSEPAETAGWSSRAWAVYGRAWGRARERHGRRFVDPTQAREPTLTVRDLLGGLAGSSAVVDAVLAKLPLEAPELDEVLEPRTPWVESREALAADDVVDVMVLNDDTTPMDFVIAKLEDTFGCSKVRARYLMLAVHLGHRARVASSTRADAERRVAEVEAYARAHGFPLMFAVGRRGTV